MSLESIITNPIYYTHVKNARNDSGISNIERAGKILSSLYLIKNDTSSIEPILFLSVPNSFDHIIHILENIDNLGMSVRDAIREEINIILTDPNSERITARNFAENSKNKRNETVERVERGIEKGIGKRVEKGVEKRVERGIENLFDSIVDRRSDKHSERSDITESTNQEEKIERLGKIEHRKLSIDSLEHRFEKLENSIISRTERRLNDVKDTVEKYFKKYKIDIVDIVELIKQLVNSFSTIKNEIMDQLGSYFIKFFSEHKDLLQSIIGKIFRAYYVKIKPYLLDIQNRIEKYATKEGVKVVKEIEKEVVPSFLQKSINLPKKEKKEKIETVIIKNSPLNNSEEEVIINDNQKLVVDSKGDIIIENEQGCNQS